MNKIYFETELLAEDYALSLGIINFEIHYNMVARGYEIAVFNEDWEYLHNVEEEM